MVTGHTVVILIIISSSLITIPIFAASYPESIVNSLTEYYNLRGEAYEKHGNHYMAFLSYDKAGNQDKKDISYNQWRLYQNKLKNLEEEIEKFNFEFDAYQRIINEAWEIKDFETVLKYSDELARQMPFTWVAYDKKYRTLVFLEKQNEAMIVYEKSVDARELPRTSSSYVGAKMDLLYSIGEYSEVIRVLEEAVYDYGLYQINEYSIPDVGDDKEMLLAMSYEKLGNNNEANFWYDQVSYIDIWGKDCLKALHLNNMGLHEEVVQIMESNDKINSCDQSFKIPYIISKDVVTGAYHPPIEHTSKSSEIVCGVGTTRNEQGQCIPEKIVKENLPCSWGIQLNSGICIYPHYSTAKEFNFPFDPSNGAEYYLDRYYSEVEYRNWFKKNYPTLTIEEAIGLLEPYSRIKERVDECPAKARSDYDRRLKNYISGGGSVIGADHTIGSVNDFLISCIERTGLPALNDVGIILAERDQHQKAIEYYDKALDLHPDYAIVMANKASSLTELGKYEESIQLFDRAIDLYPSEPEIKKSRDYAISQIETKDVSDTSCGKGTVEKNGLCVPDPNYRKESTTERSGGGCLIATATFGSELALQVQQLREIRDNSLLQTQSGQAFMQTFNEFYYSFSPVIADYERENPAFKEVVKLTLTPLLTSLSILNYVNTDSESEILGFGIGLILLNIGLYFGVPLIAIYRIKKYFRS